MLRNIMDLSQFAVDASAIDALSAYQITRFFSIHPSTTEDVCKKMASALIGSTVSPTPVQGQFSYTVVSDSKLNPKIVQFRHAALDLERMNQAKQTYGAMVPLCEFRDMLADVYVYEMDRISGSSFCRVRRQLFAPGMKLQLLQIVQDLARFLSLR